MKRVLVVVLACVSFCAYGAAQQTDGDVPATKEDIQKYFAVVHTREMVTQMMEAMAKPIHQMVHEQYLRQKDQLPEDFEAQENKRIDERIKSIPWAEVLDRTIPIYQKHFTKNDVDALVAFYETPTGQKLLKELPQITAEAIQTVIPILHENIDGMNKQVQEEVAAMVKGAKPKSDAAAPKIN